VIVVWAGIARRRSTGLVGTMTFLVVIGCGAIIVYCVWLAASTITFRIIRGDYVMQLLDGIYEAGRWPVTLYPTGSGWASRSSSPWRSRSPCPPR
jgi:ABC-type uncharacterized transport system permease subunit